MIAAGSEKSGASSNCFFCCPCVALFSALRLVNYLFIAAEAVSATKKVNYTILPS